MQCVKDSLQITVLLIKRELHFAVVDLALQRGYGIALSGRRVADGVSFQGKGEGAAQVWHLRRSQPN